MDVCIAACSDYTLPALCSNKLYQISGERATSLCWIATSPQGEIKITTSINSYDYVKKFFMVFTQRYAG